MMESDTRPDLRPVTLAFRNRREEARYIEHHFETSIIPIRLAALSALLVLLIFGYMDYRLFPEYYRTIWIARGACAIYVVAAFALTYTSYYRQLIQPIMALGTVLCCVLAIDMIYITRGDPFCAYLYVGILICVIFACIFLRLCFPWAAGSSLLMLAMFLVFAGNDVLEPEIFFINAVYLTLGTVTSILGAYSIEIHLRQNYWQARLLDRQARQLDRARLENQMLLHRIFHPSIVDRLNKGETVIADVKEASVLFADIVGSTNLATRLGSNELVKKLNDIFRDLGRLVTDRQLETIKTIGDGCMVAGNCNNPLLDHVDAMVDLALAMRETIKHYTDAEGHPLQLRIGIHVGPVVAGVMNHGKLSYDLWGDTVNVASRMESQGGEGDIQVTQQVIDIIGPKYRFDGPFLIDVKGKGPMPVYRVLGRLAESSPSPTERPERGGPNELATDACLDVTEAPSSILTIEEGAPQPTSTPRRRRLGMLRKFPKLPMMWQRPRRR